MYADKQGTALAWLGRSKLSVFSDDDSENRSNIGRERRPFCDLPLVRTRGSVKQCVSVAGAADVRPTITTLAVS